MDESFEVTFKAADSSFTLTEDLVNELWDIVEENPDLTELRLFKDGKVYNISIVKEKWSPFDTKPVRLKVPNAVIDQMKKYYC